MFLRLKIILISILISSAAHAKCNVIYDIGDNLSKMEKEYGPPPPYRYPGMNIYPFFAKDICPGEGLDEGIMIEYRFVNNILVAINFVALNDENNNISKKLTLMKYTKKVYGDFDTTQNPDSFTGFHIFEKSDEFVVYQRFLGEENKIDEQLYLSTKKYDQILAEHINNFELGKIEEELDQSQ